MKYIGIFLHKNKGKLMNKLTMIFLISLLGVASVSAQNIAPVNDSLDGFGTRRSHKLRDFTVAYHRLHVDKLDLGDTGPSVGDITVSTGELISMKTGIAVGTYVARRILVAILQPKGDITDDTLIEFKANNGDGTITTTGLQDDPAGTHFPVGKEGEAIIGGTGRWAGAKGVRYSDEILDRPGYRLATFNFN